MAKKAVKLQRAPRSQLEIDLIDLPKLRVFGMPLADAFDLAITLDWTFPDDSILKGQKVEKKPGSFFVKLSLIGSKATLKISKTTGFDWKYLTKMLGGIVERFLDAPDDTLLSITLGRGKKTQVYHGIILDRRFCLIDSQPLVAENELRKAWEFAQQQGRASVTCADATEAAVLDDICKSHKNLRDATVIRHGQRFECAEYPDHLLGCLFHIRHGAAWHLPILTQKKKSLPSNDQVGSRKKVIQTQFDNPTSKAPVCEELLQFIQHLTNGRLKSRKLPSATLTQQWYLPSSQAKQADVEFARLTAMNNQVFLELRPLQENVGLASSVPRQLKKYLCQTVEGIPLERLNDRMLETLKAILRQTFAWFEKAFVDQSITPVYPIQPSGSCIFEKHSPLKTAKSEIDLDSDQDAEGPDHAYGDLAKWRTVSKPISNRLAAVFGSGTWKRAELAMRIKLFDWDEICHAEVHWYACGKRSVKCEPWRVRHFIKCRAKPINCHKEVICIAATDFRASLQTGARYICTGRIGRRYVGYLRVRDESAEEYWYPETFFDW